MAGDAQPQGQRIPRVIHRVWVGPPMPAHLAAYGQTWQDHHPGWEHRLWTEDDLPSLRNQKLYDDAVRIAPRNVGQFRADIVRYELLERVGGVYVDCDFECRQPLDPLLEDIGCFAAWEVPNHWVNNAIMGATPGHAFVTALIDGLAANVRRRSGARPNRLSGPQYMTPLYRRFAADVTVFPKEWFYPYLHDELERGGEDFPDAVAVHHWHNRRTNA